MGLREEVTAIIQNECRCDAFEADIAWTRILAIPRIREALRDGEHDPATCPICVSRDK